MVITTHDIAFATDVVLFLYEEVGALSQHCMWARDNLKAEKRVADAGVAGGVPSDLIGSCWRLPYLIGICLCRAGATCKAMQAARAEFWDNG